MSVLLGGLFSDVCSAMTDIPFFEYQVSQSSWRLPRLTKKKFVIWSLACCLRFQEEHSFIQTHVDRASLLYAYNSEVMSSWIQKDIRVHVLWRRFLWKE